MKLNYTKAVLRNTCLAQESAHYECHDLGGRIVMVRES